MVEFFQDHTSLMNALVAAGGILSIGAVVSVWERISVGRRKKPFIPVRCPNCGFLAGRSSHPGIYTMTNCPCGFSGTVEVSEDFIPIPLTAVRERIAREIEAKADSLTADDYPTKPLISGYKAAARIARGADR